MLGKYKSLPSSSCQGESHTFCKLTFNLQQQKWAIIVVKLQLTFCHCNLTFNLQQQKWAICIVVKLKLNFYHSTLTVKTERP